VSVKPHSSGVAPLEGAPTPTPGFAVGNLVPLDAPSAIDAEELKVAIRSAFGENFTFPSEIRAERAIFWSQVIRNRHRWGGVDGDLHLPETIRDFFESIGLTARDLGWIAAAEVVEVSIPFRDDSGWGARIFPWEAMLSAATEGLRAEGPLIVIRRLEMNQGKVRGDKQEPASSVEEPAEPPNAHFVRSVPVGLEGWGFDSEELRMVANLPGYDAITLRDPTLEEMVDLIANDKPTLVHFAGFDTWQGALLLDLPYSAARRDGLLFVNDDGERDEVGAGRMLSLMVDLRYRPRLVALNVFNSASRLAPSLVASGVGAAIGIQDVVDNQLAERFFERFYESLTEAESRPSSPRACSVLAAFLKSQIAFQAGSEEVVGTGIVLWRAEPITDSPAVVSDFRAAQAALRAESSAWPTPAVGPSDSGEWQFAAFSRSLADWPLELPRIQPITQLNYSMLHNRGGLFREFVLQRKPKREEAISDVTVRVELDLGAWGPCSWEGTFDIEERQVLVLGPKVRLPLISDLQRGLRHTLRTNLKVGIEHAGKSRFRKTFPVDLLAIHEWRDDGAARDLLPSFVLPNDPAVPPIIDAAQRYLRTLLDTPEMGFTGYQGFPDATLSAQIAWARKVIDPQVRALWSTLLQDHHIRYVNQPPTDTWSSQRIRTPTDVISHGHGTCIDLAVLMAACLEYVDLAPVLFLLGGHAMPGYWRSNAARDRFMFSGLGASVPATDPIPGGGGVAAAWSFDRSYTAAIRQMMNDEVLVPIETTFLAKGRGFDNACFQGREALESRRLDALLDVRSARRFNVTPLPITKEGLR
jgi:CHAT domain